MQLTLEVLDFTGDEQDMADEYRDLFIPWLEENRPDLAITSTTEWDTTVVKPSILVVTHYLFFNDEWEMGIMWHNTIAPHDWVRIYLRKRFVEMAPSEGFEISSFSNGETPAPMDPPEEVDR